MDPDSSKTGTLRPYSTQSISGYASVTSSLPGSGAVTPRTPAFPESEPGEHTALLGEGRRDIGEAEEGPVHTGESSQSHVERLRRGLWHVMHVRMGQAYHTVQDIEKYLLEQRECNPSGLATSSARVPLLWLRVCTQMQALPC